MYAIVKRLVPACIYYNIINVACNERNPTRPAAAEARRIKIYVSKTVVRRPAPLRLIVRNIYMETRGKPPMAAA